MLERDTDWRQGDILTRESAAELGLTNSSEETHRAIVIPHDCDLPSAVEPFVEVIVAIQAPPSSKPDPQLSHAKNPRRLHLPYERHDGTPTLLELRQTDRKTIQKAAFFEIAAKDNSLTLSADTKRTLKQWLAARYGRAAFPNEFESRLRKSFDKRTTVEQRIAKILAPESRHLLAIFFDLGDQRGKEAVAGEPYALSIVVVYDAIEGGPGARQSAEAVVEQLRELFDRAYGRPDLASEIALDACEAVADTHLTLADLRRVDQWRLEYVSLRDDDQGNFLPVGEMPA